MSYSSTQDVARRSVRRRRGVGDAEFGCAADQELDMSDGTCVPKGTAKMPAPMQVPTIQLPGVNLPPFLGGQPTPSAQPTPGNPFPGIVLPPGVSFPPMNQPAPPTQPPAKPPAPVAPSTAARYIPWVIGGVVVVGAIVVLSK